MIKNPGSDIKNENISAKELPEEFHKLIIRKFKKPKVYSPFIDNVWGADLTKDFLHYVFLMLSVNAPGLFL